ncbi:MAG: glycosyltransferase family 2 protein [Candidatus Woesearchaeota archaeon]
MPIGKILLYIVTYFGLFTSTLFFITLLERRSEIKSPKPRRLPSVSLVVPAYNEEKTISRTLRSLLELDYPKSKLEIMVVDDGSTDRTYSIAKRFEKRGIKVLTKPNTGKGNSLNHALKKAKGELFAALDADSFASPDCLRKMVAYFGNPKVMAVTPSLKVYHPKGFLQRIQSVEYLVGIYLRKVFGMMGSIHVTPGPLTIYRKEFFDKYGPYDGDNITEDIEIALRIQSKRYIVENAADASVYTVGPDTFNSLMRQRRRWYLGFINNVQRYKNLFHPSYGNLGIFILPGSFFSVLLAIMVCSYALIRSFTNLGKEISNLFAINFDILPLIDLNVDLFTLNFGPLAILSVISIMVGVTIICLAKMISEEKSKIKLSYIIYLIAYWFIFAYWWIIAGFYKLTGKSIGWGSKTT